MMRRVSSLFLAAVLAAGCVGAPSPAPTATPVPCDGTLLPFVTLSRLREPTRGYSETSLRWDSAHYVEAVTDAGRLAVVLDDITGFAGEGRPTVTPMPAVDLRRQTVLVATLYLASWAWEPLEIVGICQDADGLTVVAAIRPTEAYTLVPAAEIHPFHAVVVENAALRYHGETPVRLVDEEGELWYSGTVVLPAE